MDQHVIAERNSWLSPCDPAQPDSLFVCSASPDPRCLHVSNSLSSSYRVGRAVILRFLTRAKPKEGAWNNASKLRGLWRERSLAGEDPDIVLSPRDDVEATLGELSARLSSGHLSGPITIDISTLMRPYVFGLVHFFRRFYPELPLRFVYSPRWAPLDSSGVPKISHDPYEVSPIPLFSNLGDGVEKHRTLVLFLGFEEHRAIAIEQAIEPTEVIPLIGSAGPETTGRKTAMRANQSLLAAIAQEYGHGPLFHDSWNPEEVVGRLNQVLAKGTDDTIFLVAPLGPKIEAVALAVALRLTLRRFQVVYASVHVHDVPEDAGEVPTQPMLEFVAQDLESAIARGASSAGRAATPALAH